jgi:hypothetical protein
MPYLPLIGYSQKELDNAYARGVNAARLEDRRGVFAVLVRLMPEMHSQFAYAEAPALAEMLAWLENAWQVTLEPERERRRLLEMDNDTLRRQVKRQEEELSTSQAVNGQVDELEARVQALLQDCVEVRAELARVQTETQEQLAARNQELEKAYALIVKYETQAQQQKAKMPGL